MTGKRKGQEAKNSKGQQQNTRDMKKNDIQESRQKIGYSEKDKEKNRKSEERKRHEVAESISNEQVTKHEFWEER